MMNDYILVSDIDQGWDPGNNLANISNDISARPESFQPIDAFSLPNGDLIRLYKVGT